MKTKVVLDVSFPVSRHAVLKNNKQIRKNRRTGQVFIGSNDKVIEAKENMLNYLEKYKKEYRIKAVSNPVHVIFKFYFTDFYVKTGKNEGKKSKRIPDLSNLYQLPEDCLENALIIKDDAQIIAHDGSRALPSLKDYNYIEIKVLELIGQSINY